MRVSFLSLSAASCAALLLNPGPASACSDISDDTKRLACYDGLAASTAGDCVVEAWTASMRGSNPYMTGSLSCEAGRLDYRLFDKESGEFLASGFTFFQGYAFQAYPDMRAWSGAAEMRFVIQEN